MNHAVTISITDNGVGIDAGELTTIFDPFVTHKKAEPVLDLPLPNGSSRLMAAPSMPNQRPAKALPL